MWENQKHGMKITKVSKLGDSKSTPIPEGEYAAEYMTFAIVWIFVLDTTNPVKRYHLWSNSRILNNINYIVVHCCRIERECTILDCLHKAVSRLRTGDINLDVHAPARLKRIQARLQQVQLP